MGNDSTASKTDADEDDRRKRLPPTANRIDFRPKEMTEKVATTKHDERKHATEDAYGMRNGPKTATEREEKRINDGNAKREENHKSDCVT